MTSIATEHLTRLREYKVVVYKEYKHAIWPKEVDLHLGGRYHKMEKEERKSIQDALSLSSVSCLPYQTPAERLEYKPSMQVTENSK